MIASGIDFAHKSHDFTNERLENLFSELYTTCERPKAEQDRGHAQVFTVVDEAKQALFAQHESSEHLSMARHEEIRTQLTRLQLTITANHAQRQDILVCMGALADESKVYFRLLVEILTGLAQQVK